ncbi:MAG: hypothetical protein IKM88_00435, partial [Lachnospiraceae bacterium]|nr:hypothetical protein [Lachnospiraceae bacterium]
LRQILRGLLSQRQDLPVVAIGIYIEDPALIIRKQHHRLKRAGKRMHRLAGDAVMLQDGFQGVNPGAGNVAVGIDEQLRMGYAIERQLIEGILKELGIHACCGYACKHGLPPFCGDVNYYYYSISRRKMQGCRAFDYFEKTEKKLLTKRKSYGIILKIVQERAIRSGTGVSISLPDTSGEIQKEVQSTWQS